MSTNYNCDLVMLVPHLGDGGTQKIVTTLANAWDKKGKRITIVTIYDHSDEYILNSGVKRLKLSDVQDASGSFYTYILGQLNLWKSEIKFKPLYFLFILFVYLIVLLINIFRFLSFLSSKTKILLLRFNEIINNIINRLINFKSRHGFGFFGISYYFIMFVFYTRKIVRICVSLFYLPLKLLGPYLHILSRARAIRSVVKSENPRVVVSFIGSTNILTTIACKFLGKRIVISERNDPAIQELNHPYNKLRPYVYKYADIVTANTHNALVTMRKYVPEKKLAYVPNPLDINIKNNKITKTEKCHNFILSVGRLHEQKAYDILLEAIKLISHELDNWRLLVLGKGELKKELHQLTCDLEISHLVDWKGHVSNPYKYYNMADIYVLPSRHEGMSNSLLEAMTFGLPVVISDACYGLLEIINNGENGIVIPVNDPNALADAIIKLIQDESLRNFLGNNAREAVKKFELNNVMGTWEKILYGN